MPEKRAKTLADYRNAHDADTVVTGRIDKALAALRASGPEAWEYELDFARLAGISANAPPRYRERYAAHVVEAPSVGGVSRNNRTRFVWVGDAKVAKRMRGDQPRG